VSESEEIIVLPGNHLRGTPLNDQARSTWLNRSSGKEVGNFRPHSPWEGYHLDIPPSPEEGSRSPIDHNPRWAKDPRIHGLAVSYCQAQLNRAELGSPA
jgi:hypothetical protein